MRKLILALGLLVLSTAAFAEQVTAPNPPNGDDSNRIATTHWVNVNAGGGGGGGGVTSITAGTGLNGGTITTIGTISVKYGTISGTAAQGNDSRITGALQAANNLSDVASASTALSNLSGVPTSRTLTAGSGIATIGDLSTNRTISLASIAAGTVLANTGGGSAAPSASTPSNVLDIIGSTRGQVLFRGDSGWTALAPGSNGQVLTSGGAGADVSWNTLSGTVTSVAATGGTGISVTGSPITTTGTLTISPTGKLADLAGLSMTQGSVLYYNGSNLVSLAPGTNGQVLTTQGASANPHWVAAPSGNVPVGGSTGQALIKASGTDYDTTWSTIAGTGTVTGPVSSTDNAIARWDSTSGIPLLNSGVIIDDSNNITGVTSLNKVAITQPASGATLTIEDGFTLDVDGDATVSGTNTGDQTITLSGAVSGSGTSAITTSFTDDSINALVGVSPAADRVFYYDSATTGQMAILTSAGRTLIGGSDASAQRTSLGVGTGDSPQFTAINVGAATDTTLSRVSAGVVAVEGDTLLGASENLSNVASASTALSNLGGLPIAGGTMTGAFVGAVVALTDGATPALNAALGNTFTLTSTTNPTIAIPSNPTSGEKIVIAFTASGGSRTMSLNSGAGGFRFGTDITGLTATTSGKTDYVGAIYNSGASFWDVVAYAKGY